MLEMFRARVFRFAKVVGHGAAESAVDAERNRAAADAVDAECQVEHQAEQRQKPDEPDPERGCAGIALVAEGREPRQTGTRAGRSPLRRAARSGRWVQANASRGSVVGKPAARKHGKLREYVQAIVYFIQGFGGMLCCCRLLLPAKNQHNSIGWKRCVGDHPHRNIPFKKGSSERMCWCR